MYFPQRKTNSFPLNLRYSAHRTYQGPYWLSGKTSCRQISWSLEGASLVVLMIVSLWNLAAILAALLSMCLSNLERLKMFKPETHGFATSRDLAARRPPAWWIKALQALAPRYALSLTFRCVDFSEIISVITLIWMVLVIKVFENKHDP